MAAETLLSSKFLVLDHHIFFTFGSLENIFRPKFFVKLRSDVDFTRNFTKNGGTFHIETKSENEFLTSKMGVQSSKREHPITQVLGEYLSSTTQVVKFLVEYLSNTPGSTTPQHAPKFHHSPPHTDQHAPKLHHTTALHTPTNSPKFHPTTPQPSSHQIGRAHV